MNNKIIFFLLDFMCTSTDQSSVFKYPFYCLFMLWKSFMKVLLV